MTSWLSFLWHGVCSVDRIPFGRWHRSGGELLAKPDDKSTTDDSWRYFRSSYIGCDATSFRVTRNATS